MFKLLILLSSSSLASAPINQLYQNHQSIKVSEQKSEDEKEYDKKQRYVSSSESKGRKASIDELKKFDYLVPNWEWFTKLNSAKSFGYADRDDSYGSNGGIGLCEYISMTMLLEYQELFISSGFFTDSEWKQYFENSYDGNNQIWMPTHKYYTDWNSPNGSLGGVPERLQKIVGETDLTSGKKVNKGFNGFLDGKNIQNKTEQKWSASWGHTSKVSDYIVKEKVPVMFSFVMSNFTGHNVTVFGYNSNTNELAIHYGWSNSSGEFSARIIKQSTFWSFGSMGFWNTIYIPNNNSKNDPRKAFKYQDDYYSWDQLERMGKKWTDVKPF